MPLKPRLIAASALAVAVLAAAALYASPYLALRSIHSALKAQDAHALSDYVDYPALRQNLKARLTQSMADKLPAQGNAGAFGSVAQAIGGAIGGAVVGAAVDRLVSPEGVMLALQHSPFNAQAPRPAASTTEGAGTSASGGARFSLDYQGLNQVRVYRPAAPDQAFIFARSGLFGWKLVNLDMPLL